MIKTQNGNRSIKLLYLISKNIKKGIRKIILIKNWKIIWLKPVIIKISAGTCSLVKIPEPEEKADMELRKDEVKTPHRIVPTIT